MECCCAESNHSIAIVSEENRHCHLSPHDCGSALADHRDEASPPCPGYDETTSSMEHQPVAALPALTHDSQLPPPRGDGTRASAAPDLTELSSEEAALPFSKEVIAFSLFGRIHPKCSEFPNYSLAYSYARWRRFRHSDQL